MNQQLTLTALSFCFILFLSCQKEPDENLIPRTPTSRVKTYTETVTSPAGNYSGSFDISYDNNGRVVGMTSTTTPGDKFVYAYPSNTLYTMDLYDGGVLSIHEDFYLNAFSLIDSTFQYNDTGDTLTEGYKYNANKQLITVKQYDYSKLTGSSLWNITTYTYDAAGNLIKSEDTDGEIHTYEYYSNYSYVPPLTVGPITVNSTKKINLVKSETVTSNGSLLGSAVVTYTFDDKDRISTETAVLNDGSTVTKAYTYF